MEEGALKQVGRLVLLPGGRAWRICWLWGTTYEVHTRVANKIHTYTISPTLERAGVCRWMPALSWDAPYD